MLKAIFIGLATPILNVIIGGSAYAMIFCMIEGTRVLNGFGLSLWSTTITYIVVAPVSILFVPMVNRYSMDSIKNRKQIFSIITLALFGFSFVFIIASLFDMQDNNFSKNIEFNSMISVYGATHFISMRILCTFNFRKKNSEINS